MFSFEGDALYTCAAHRIPYGCRVCYCSHILQQTTVRATRVLLHTYATLQPIGPRARSLHVATPAHVYTIHGQPITSARSRRSLYGARKLHKYTSQSQIKAFSTLITAVTSASTFESARANPNLKPVFEKHKCTSSCATMSRQNSHMTAKYQKVQYLESFTVAD